MHGRLNLAIIFSQQYLHVHEQAEPAGRGEVIMEQLRHTSLVLTLQWSGADLLHGVSTAPLSHPIFSLLIAIFLLSCDDTSPFVYCDMPEPMPASGLWDLGAAIDAHTCSAQCKLRFNASCMQ